MYNLLLIRLPLRRCHFFTLTVTPRSFGNYSGDPLYAQMLRKESLYIYLLREYEQNITNGIS